MLVVVGKFGILIQTRGEAASRVRLCRTAAEMSDQLLGKTWKGEKQPAIVKVNDAHGLKFPFVLLIAES
jgi:hypothetical protein